MFADDDLMTLATPSTMFDALPNAELAVVPGTSHFLTQEKPHLVNALVVDFLTNEPVATVAPDPPGPPTRRRTHRADARRSRPSTPTTAPTSGSPAWPAG